MLYYVLDESHQLEIVLHATSDTICKEFGISKKTFRQRLTTNTPICEHYTIIEDEENGKEEWLCCGKYNNRNYFVSSSGNFKMYDIKKKTYSYDFISGREDHKIVRFEDVTISLKDLVAMTFSCEYEEGCKVKFKNCKTNNLYDIDNLRIVTKKRNEVLKPKFVQETKTMADNQLTMGIFFDSKEESLKGQDEHLKLDPTLVKVQLQTCSTTL